MEKMQSQCNFMTFAAFYKSRWVQRRTVKRGDDSSIPPTAAAFGKLGNFVHPTLTCVIRKKH